MILFRVDGSKMLVPSKHRNGFTWFTGEAAGEGIQEKERRERTRGGRGRKRDWSLVP